MPYPADTEIIANVVTSPHHLGATMVTERTHRMTELFGRLAPGASLEEARAELTAAHAAMMREHPEAYSAKADVQLSVTPLRDQITAPARTILLVLLAAAGIVFVIACSNVANLILARSVRREGELAVRAALGASRGALRRTLLAESLVLCGAGAVLGVLLARPLVAVVARFAARFSVRALEVTVDASLLWVGAGLAMAAAVLLAYVPRLPVDCTRRPGSGAGERQRPDHARHQPPPAGVRDDADRVLVRAARRRGHAPRRARRAADGEHRLQHAAGAGVRRSDPVARHPGRAGDGLLSGGDAAHRRAAGRGRRVALGSFVPWRDAGTSVPRFQFAVEGYTPADGEENPHARLRIVAPGFFAVLGVPLLAGRDFTDDDRTRQRARRDREPERRAAAVPERRRARTGRCGGPIRSSASPAPRRIVGVVADVDDENVVRGPALTIYHPVQQIGVAGRLFVHAAGDPYALVPPVTRIIREMSADQPVERAATLEDVRAEVLAPERLNAFVFSGFAGVALLDRRRRRGGRAGVLGERAHARVRRAAGRRLDAAPPADAASCRRARCIVAIGIVAGAAGGYAFARRGGELSRERAPARRAADRSARPPSSSAPPSSPR